MRKISINWIRAVAVLVTVALSAGVDLRGQSDSPQDQDDAVFELSPFEVVGSEGNNEWTINQSSGGTRVAVPIKELPFSLDVLTTEFMEDFVLSDMSEALPHVGNVSTLESHTGAGSGNAVRGFSQYFQLRNGFYRNGVIGRTLVDRVEVVKGPYAAIYGRSEPGGVINYISKKPVFGEKKGELRFHLGTNETYRFQFEQNLPVAEHTALLVAGSYFEREFDQEYTHERSRNFGVVLSHKFSDRTSVTAEYEHMFRRNNRGRPVTDIRINGTDPSDGSRNKYTGEFAFDFIEEYGWINTLGPYMFNDRTLDTINLTLTHRFADDVTFRLAFNDSVTTQDYNYSANSSSTIRVDPITGEFERWNNTPYPHWRLLPTDVTNIQADLTVAFNVGESEHSTLLTFDHSQQLDGRVSLRAPRGRATDVHTVDYDPSTPEFDGTPPHYQSDAEALHSPSTDIYTVFDPSINFFDTPEYYSYVNENRTLDYDIQGVFLMHRAKLFDGKLLLMAGGRYDEAETLITDRRTPDLTAIRSQTVSKVDDFTYNFGANFNLNARTLLFASQSTSFNPKGDVFSHTGLPMPNEKGEGYEFGFRSSIFDDKVDWGASYFEIERQNIRIRNPDFDRDVDSPDDKAEFVPGGLDRATGYELFASGKLLDSLTLRASVGLVDAVHVSSLDAWKEGLRLRRVPEWNYSLGAKYRVNEGGLKGFSVSLSYRAQSDYRLQDRTPRSTDLRNNLRSDEAQFLDLSFGYGWKSGESLRSSVRVAVRNALDDIYIIGSGYFSDGRQVEGSYSLRF